MPCSLPSEDVKPSPAARHRTAVRAGGTTVQILRGIAAGTRHVAGYNGPRGGHHPFLFNQTFFPPQSEVPMSRLRFRSRSRGSPRGNRRGKPSGSARGLTLVELCVILLIVVVLFVVFVPVLSSRTHEG